MQLPTFLLSVILSTSALTLGVRTSDLAEDTASSNSTHSVTKRSSENVKLVCYYSNWAIYRPGLAKFTPQNINPFLCTHLIYAFAGLSSKYEMKPFDPYNDIKQGNYQKFVGLKKYNSQLKTMIAIGGWNEGSKRFSKLVATPELRFTFIKSAMKFLRDHSFDGIDFDWEYPAFREGSTPEDKEGYAKLIREIRYAFNNEKLSAGRERLLVSVAVPAGMDYIDQGFDVPTISQYADFLNVLSYDYHTSFDPETDHHAPLKAKPGTLDQEAAKLNVEWTINYYIKKGAPREKLIVGIPTYGRSFSLTDPNNNGVNALAEGPGEPGPSTREKGYLAFYEICQKVEDEDWQLHRPYAHVEGPFAVKDKQWVAFDDIEIIQDKARFIIDNGLGGAMVWTLDNDDFRGTCYGEQNPLISSLRAALINSGPQVQGSPSETSSSRLLRPNKPPTSANPEISEAGLNALNVNTRRNQRRRQFYATTSTSTTTTTTTTTTPAPTTSRDLLSYTTPQPPTTPDPGVEFACEDEGFFNNPKDCRKYFWCLDSGPANLGIVAHSFTCPSGLFFNSKTEACDYAGNVQCKIKKDTSATTAKPKARSKPKIATTTAPQVTTTPRPTTTTQLPITGPPEGENDRMLVDTMRKFNNAKASGNADELAQLASLIKSLGGIEKVQSLLKGNGDSNLSSQSATTLNFFAPSYVTPNRQSEPVTQPPPAATNTELPSGRRRENDAASKPVRQRRPQFDYESAAVMTTPAPTNTNLFSYYEKPRSTSSNGNSNQQTARSSSGDRSSSGQQGSEQFTMRRPSPNQPKPFEFSYAMPDGRNSLMGAFNDMNARRSGGAEMTAMMANTSMLQESPPESSANTRPVYRVPIRVNPGSLVKVPAEAIAGLNGRRSQQSSRRLRVQSGFAVISDKPGVVYEDEFLLDKRPLPFQPEPFLPPPSTAEHSSVGGVPPSLQHQFGPPSYQFENNKLEGVKPATQRRRPQNQFNIPYEESPISLLINTPPRSSPQEARQPELPPTTTTPPPTTQYIAPQTVKFTNYNTLPPEFDISPFTSPDFHNSVSAKNFQKSANPLSRLNAAAFNTESTTPLPTAEGGPRQGGRRRIARPRRPIPTLGSSALPPATMTMMTSAMTSSTTSTTTRRPQKRLEESEPVVASNAENFNGPAVFANKEGGLGCSKRGVFAHPESCGMFVVCAPAGRGKKGMRTLTHHCPADQVFVQDVGRCRPGNKNRCEVF